MFEIRSESDVYNQVEKPAAVFDKSSGVLFAIGEYDDMLKQYHAICAAYTSNGYQDMAKPIVCMELPKDQDEIDKVFQITGYIKQLYDKNIPFAN